MVPTRQLTSGVWSRKMLLPDNNGGTEEHPLKVEGKAAVPGSDSSIDRTSLRWSSGTVPSVTTEGDSTAAHDSNPAQNEVEEELNR